MTTLDPVRLGLAAGALWGLAMLLTTLLALATGYADGFLAIMASLYPGYDISITGSAIGLVYGFIDGFVSMFLLGWVYNLLGPKRS